MQTPFVPEGVEDEKEAGIPLQSSGHDRGEHSADAAQRTRVPHFLENESRREGRWTKKLERLPLEMITGTEPALFCHRNAKKKSPAFIQKLAACGEDGAH